jgi:hypothetical protein
MPGWDTRRLLTEGPPCHGILAQSKKDWCCCSQACINLSHTLAQIGLRYKWSAQLKSITDPRSLLKNYLALLDGKGVVLLAGSDYICFHSCSFDALRSKNHLDTPVVTELWETPVVLADWPPVKIYQGMRIVSLTLFFAVYAVSYFLHELSKWLIRLCMITVW